MEQLYTGNTLAQIGEKHPEDGAPRVGASLAVPTAVLDTEAPAG
jgi:hypothetical protein